MPFIKPSTSFIFMKEAINKGDDVNKSNAIIYVNQKLNPDQFNDSVNVTIHTLSHTSRLGLGISSVFWIYVPSSLFHLSVQKHNPFSVNIVYFGFRSMFDFWIICSFINNDLDVDRYYCTFVAAIFPINSYWWNVFHPSRILFVWTIFANWQ